MCGVPYHSVEAYIGRLISKGYKVAICEQTEDPSTAKGIVRREVVREITPGTIIESSMLTENKNNYLCSVYFDKGRTGLCFADISTGEMSATIVENEPSRVLNELGTYMPREIITNISKENDTYLGDFARERLNALVEYELGYYNYQKCTENVLNQFGKELFDSNELDSSLILAIGAILEYIIKTQKTDISYINQINVYSQGQYL